MDKALNQLSVPLGQLREEVMVCVMSQSQINSCHKRFYACWCLLQSLRLCVSEVIQAIDNQLSKQEDLQKKKVCCFPRYLNFMIVWPFYLGFAPVLEPFHSNTHFQKVNSCHHPPGVCTEANPSGALGGEDREDPPLTELQGIQFSGDQQVGITWTNSLGVTERGAGYLPSHTSLNIYILISVCVQSFISRSDSGENSYRIQPAAVSRCAEQRHAPAWQSQTSKFLCSSVNLRKINQLLFGPSL